MGPDDGKGHDGRASTHLGDLRTSEDNGGQEEMDGEGGEGDEKEEGDEGDSWRFQLCDGHALG